MSLNQRLLRCQIIDDNFPTLITKPKCHTCDREVSKIRHDGRRIFGRNVVVESEEKFDFSPSNVVDGVKICDTLDILEEISD